jgi:hypothetical protein
VRQRGEAARWRFKPFRPYGRRVVGKDMVVEEWRIECDLPEPRSRIDQLVREVVAGSIVG